MKKLLYVSLLFVSIVFYSSCEKDEVGGLATEKMAGEWYVMVDAVDANGDIVYEDADLFGMGRIHLNTYNTTTDDVDEIWVDDNENFWAFKNKVSIDLNQNTFQVVDSQNEYYDIQVSIKNGKILSDATKTPSGMVADSIVFFVNFSDDTYPTDYGFDSYRVSGFRYTGFSSDN
jgi:hypothetical protein